MEVHGPFEVKGEPYTIEGSKLLVKVDTEPVVTDTAAEETEPDANAPGPVGPSRIGNLIPVVVIVLIVVIIAALTTLLAKKPQAKE